MTRLPHSPGRRGLIFLFFLVALWPRAGSAFDRRTPVVQTVEKAAPAVVNIRTERIVKQRGSSFFGFGDPLFEEFFREMAPPRVSKTESLGSGAIIDPRGYVLTNAHVVEKASKIFVALPGRTKEIEGRLVGKAEFIDLAVVKLLEDGPFPALKAAAEEDLLVGETVIAIGNPLGLGHSVTTGIVSAPRRRLPRDDGSLAIFVQTDALINPGNSGGPLLNINGELVGINTAIVKQAQGIGFAIPMPIATRIMESLIGGGELAMVYSGIIPGQVGKEHTAREGTGGVLVAQVDKESPAAAADIRYGDLIREIDGTVVASPAEFFSILQTYAPGNRAKISVLRGFSAHEVTLKLDKLPPRYGLRYLEALTGLQVADGGGVKVASVRRDSPAAGTGIKAGDLIGEFAGREIRDGAQLTATVEAVLGREPWRFLIIRGRKGSYVELP